MITDLKDPFPYFGEEVSRRFWEKVLKTETCWIWQASKRNKGYGAFTWHDDDGTLNQDRAHRVVWRLFFGEIPDGQFVLHKCDNPACCNPDHLFLGTKSDNNQDMVNKGRHVPGGAHCGKSGKWKRGKEHHNVKVDENIVRNIRKDKKTKSYSQLAEKYNLSVTCLFKIVHKKTWKFVPEEVIAL
jgi:hypothetical protein